MFRRLQAAVLLAAAWGLILLQGCWNRPKEVEGLLAQVGDSLLTEEALTSTLSRIGLDPKEEATRRQYINQWVDHQLLLYEAVHRGLTKDPELLSRLRHLREEILIERLFEEEVQPAKPTEAEVIAYWRDHTGEFIRPTDEVRLVLATAPDRNSAWGVRNGMDQAQSAEDLQATFEGVVFDTTGYVPEERLPSQLRRAMRPLRPGDPSLPFKLEGQWMVIRLLERARAGQTRRLDEVADEIRARMRAEESARGRLEYIADLRRSALRRGIIRLEVPVDTTAGTTDTAATAPDTTAGDVTEENPGG